MVGTEIKFFKWNKWIQKGKVTARIVRKVNTKLTPQSPVKLEAALWLNVFP